MNKKIIFLIIAFFIAGIGSYYYLMHGGARDLSNEETAYTTNAIDIIEEFKADLDNANNKYLEKPVAVSGTITSIQDSIISLNRNIICLLKNPDVKTEINQDVIIKGRVIGYDDLLEELKLDQCFLINN